MMSFSSLWTNVKDVFWSESFWFPQNVTWKDFNNDKNGIYHPQISDLKYSLIIAVAALIIRFFFYRCIGEPVGLLLGIKDTKKREARKHPVLDAAYRKDKTPNNNVVQGLVKQTDLSERQIQRWFRVRRNQEKSSLLKRFTESSWKFAVYATTLTCGLYVLWDKPWFSYSKHFWIGYPHHHVSDDMYWYYIGELGMYMSFLLSQFLDVKRKDFWELFVHHIVTILLMLFSWVNNYVRIGTLIMLLHDTCDPVMEFAKLANYSGYGKLSDTCLVLFIVLWVITRLILYPYRCVWSVYQVELGWFGCYHVYTTLLTSLLVLHLIWTYFILRVVMSRVTGEQERKDSRSSEEETISEDDVHKDEVGNGHLKKTS